MDSFNIHSSHRFRLKKNKQNKEAYSTVIQNVILPWSVSYQKHEKKKTHLME